MTNSRHNSIPFFQVVVALFLGCLTWPIQADITMELSPAVWSSGERALYSPFDPVTYFQEETIMVYANVTESTPFFITFSTGGEQRRNQSTVRYTDIQPTVVVGQNLSYERTARSGRDSIRYQLFRRQDVTDVLKDAHALLTNRNVLNGEAGPFSPANLMLPYYWTVLPGQSVRSGVYEDVVSVTVYAGDPDNPGNAKMLYAEQLDVQVRVPSVTNITIQGDSNLVWDRKAFLNREPQDYYVIVNSNEDIVTTVETENWGVFRHPKQDLGYTMHQNRQQKDMRLTVVPRPVGGLDISGEARETVMISVKDL